MGLIDLIRYLVDMWNDLWSPKHLYNIYTIKWKYQYRLNYTSNQDKFNNWYLVTSTNNKALRERSNQVKVEKDKSRQFQSLNINNNGKVLNCNAPIFGNS